MHLIKGILRGTSAITVLAAALACAAVGITAPPAFAWPAHSLWVAAGTTVAGGGTSCSAPGYNTIQAAVDAASSGQQIIVCAGTYTEQLQITRSVQISGIGTVVVQLPSAPADATTTCDEQMVSGNVGSPPEQDQDGISICGDITVRLTGLTVDAAWAAGTCYDALYGIVVAGGATLDFDKSHITAAGAVPLNGCQGGVGIVAGDSLSSPAQVGHLVLADSTISGYQKNGIVIDGAGSTARISSAVVTGAGPTPSIAQNGIQVSDGAGATISDSTISGNECDYPTVCGSDGLTQTQSAGILIYSTDAPVDVTGSTLTGNDIGVYYQANPAEAAPKKATAVLDDDRFAADRYEGIQLDQGSALVEDCVLSGGNVGVQAIQYSSQTFGINSAVTGVTVRDMSVATIQVLSDQAAGDKAGLLLVAGSDVHSAPVLNNSTNVRLLELADY